jgi:hypothetical protein
MKAKGPGTGSLGPTRNDQQLGFNNNVLGGNPAQIFA